MHSLLFVCALFACACAQTENLDATTAQVFGNTTTKQQETTSESPPRSTTKKPQSCTKANQRGVCVLYFLCDKNGYIITTGSGVLDIRGQSRRRRRSPAEESGDEKPLNGSQQMTAELAAIDEETRPINFARRENCDSYFETCCLYRKKPTRPTVATQVQSEKPIVCGRRQPDGLAFYYTKTAPDDAKFAEFPWSVILARYERVNTSVTKGGETAIYVGSGSLIHPSVVLTAAHFTFKTTTFKVFAGSTYTGENYLQNELYPYQERHVDEIRVHEEYDKSTLIYDVALLFLASPMIMAPNVGVVCLPSPHDHPPTNTRCVNSGWGKDKFGKKGKYRRRLQKFDVMIIDRYTCQEELQQTRLGQFFELDQSFTCAMHEVLKDTCVGDGGSPLVCPIRGETNRYQQYGMVSWGIGCGNDGIPAVCVDLTRVRAWIDGAIVAKGFDPKVYTP